MSQDLQKASVHLMRLARQGRQTTGRSAYELTALHEWLAFLPAAAKGLAAREAQLLTAQALEADQEARRRAIQELEFSGWFIHIGDGVLSKIFFVSSAFAWKALEAGQEAQWRTPSRN